MKFKFLAAAFLALVTPSHAAVFTLDQDLCPGDCGHPAGEIIVDQNGANVDVNVNLNGSAFSFVKTAALDFVAFKFNAIDVVASDFTIASNSGERELEVLAGAFNGGGAGNFGFGVNCINCRNFPAEGFSGNFIFHVHNATVADLIQGNNFGYVFAADVLSFNGNIGIVAASAEPTPLPAALPLFVTGLGALGLLGWRRKRRVVAAMPR